MSQPHPVSVNDHRGAGAIYRNDQRDVSNKEAGQGNSGHANILQANGHHEHTAFESSPSQIPFNDFTGQPQRSKSHQNLPAGSQHGNFSGSESLNMASESNSRASSRLTEHEHVRTQPYPALAAAPQQRSHSDLLHPTRSSPGPLGGAGAPFDLALHDESPFEAARRAQKAQRNEGSTDSLQQSERKFIPGRVPSIKCGDIIPDYLIPLIHGPPMFMPPLEAPPFPPVPIPHPIRAAHFPSPPAESTQPSPTYFPPQPPQHQSRPQLPVQTPSTQSFRSTPSPQPPMESPPNGMYSMNQPSAERMSEAMPPHPHLARNPSRAQTLPHQPNGHNTHPAHPPPNVLRRNTHDPHMEGRSAPMPNNLQPPHPHPPGPYGSQQHLPPAQEQRDRHSPQPPSISPSQYHVQRPSPSPERPPNLPPHPPRESPPPMSSRESFRQSLRPSPLRSEFATAPNPVRLPSENMKTEQGGYRQEQGPIRGMPKPVMPPLLAPLAAKDKNADPRSPVLQRSLSAATPAEKGGLFSRTKSLLRKRNSGSGLRVAANGGISFTPPMHSVSEEDEKPKKLKRKGLF